MRAVTPQPDAREDTAGSPIAQTETGRCRRLDGHTTEGRASLMTQGQKSSQVSGPNNAPKPVRSPGWRPDPSQSKGGGPHGSRRQRCGASRGGTQASETRWRQCWSPSDGQISGLGTGSPGDNVRKPRPQPIPSEKTSSCRGPAGPVLGEPTEPRSAIPQLPCGAPGRLVSSAPLSSVGGGGPRQVVGFPRKRDPEPQDTKMHACG